MKTKEAQTPQEAMIEAMKHEVADFLTDIGQEVSFIDSSEHFLNLINIAENYAKGIQYECEQRMSSVPEL